MRVVVYRIKEPGYPTTRGAEPRAIPLRELDEVLASPHTADTVICPLAWPDGAKTGFRPTKPWLLDARSDTTPLDLILLDADRPDHTPWTGADDAAAAVAAAHASATTILDGPALVYATPRGVRVLARPAKPVPLPYADAYLAQLRERVALPGLRAPDKLTWTTGQRPPWALGRRPAPPWGPEYPPSLGRPHERIRWHCEGPLKNEREKLTRANNAAEILSAPRLRAAPTAEILADLDREVSRMVATIRTAPARHPTLYACARRLGGYLAVYAAGAEVHARLVARYAPALAGAAPGSADAERTVADGMAAGASYPAHTPSHAASLTIEALFPRSTE